MVKRTVFTLILAAALIPRAAAEHIPTVSDGGIEIQGRAIAVIDFGDFDSLVEITGRLEGGDLEFGYRAITLGGYYRLLENLKVGVFYRLQQGARHDDDWVDLMPGWEWADSTSRTEHLFIADVSPRVHLDFLPGENWVLMVKSRYIINTYNGHQSVMVRPGLSYFLMADREPLLTFSLNYGLYFPVNFGSATLYEHVPYLNILYHITPMAAIELSGAYRTVIWTTSRDVLDSSTDTYELPFKAWVFGIGAVVKYAR